MTDWTTRAHALRSEAEAASILGRRLFDADLAAALAVRQTPAVGAAGLVVTHGHDGHEVLFVDDADPPCALWSATFAADGSVIGSTVARDQGRLSPAAAARARARALLLDSVGATGMTLIIPAVHADTAPDSIDAFLIAERAPGEVVLGVHRRATVSPDGARLLSLVPLSRSPQNGSLLTVSGDHGVAARDIVATDLDGTTPGAVHVYLSLRHGVPLELLTIRSGLHWRVDGERLTVIGDLQVPA